MLSSGIGVWGVGTHRTRVHRDVIATTVETMTSSRRGVVVVRVDRARILQVVGVRRVEGVMWGNCSVEGVVLRAILSNDDVIRI
jgi:hypothetical protein